MIMAASVYVALLLLSFSSYVTFTLVSPRLPQYR
jgi:hypothetical protein